MFASVLPNSRLRVVLFSLVYTLGLVPVSVAQGPRPDAENYEAWRTHVLPAESELVWLTIPWQSSFGDGIRRAREEARPVLLWVMNGHPLGCT